MRYKRYQIECSKNYHAKIYKCPEQSSDLDFTLHWHKEYEFIYVEKGPVKLQKIDREIILNDGQVYFLNTEEVHSYSDITEDLLFTVVNIPPKAILPYISDLNGIITFKIKTDKARNNIARSLKALSQCSDLEGKVEILKIKAILNNICYYLIKDCLAPGVSYIKGSDSEDFDCAKSAILYMIQNFSRNIPLDEISTYVGMTPAHFSRYFKDKTRMTFSRYLRRIRLEHAIIDLCHNNISVKTAAEKNGFPNVNSFILTCKSEYGRTPLEMKNYAKT